MSPPLPHLESSYPSYNRLDVFEGLSVKLNPAPLLKRILAYIVDISIVGIVIYLLLYLFLALYFLGAFFLGFVQLKDWIGLYSFFALGIFFLIIVAIYDGYFVYFEYKKGATLGKKTLGLRVVATQKPKLSLAQCIFRDLFRLIDCTLIFPGLISIAITKNHQRLGDLVAGTIVTYSPRKEAESQYMYISAEQYHLFYETLKPQPVVPEHRSAFLQFSYGLFMTGKTGALSPEVSEQWQNFVLYYVPEAQKHAVDPQTLFLFFAEYCLQSSKQKT